MQTALEKTSLISDFPPSLVVSIHDVSPVTLDTVERMIADLAGIGVSATSLLVIPDHHHQVRIDADSKFSCWLRKVVTEGHEAVLHGYLHLRPLQSDENLLTRLITRSYTAGEGEFYDLSFAEAKALLCKGREALMSCGVTSEGFIAPAWLLGAEAERAVREEGFGYTTRIGTVIDCLSGVQYSARSMVYSVRACWRRNLSLLWNEMLFHTLKKSPLLRIGLHPPDWKHGAIRNHILHCLKLALCHREAMTYREWLARTRLARKSEQWLDRKSSFSH